jgi:methylated-DNA-protein-cysteine methyltransferase-like protein
MSRVDKNFKSDVMRLVSIIPEGRLMSYGQVATLCGAPWAAWEVGQIAHYGDPSIPWQRVVNKHGELAKGYPGGAKEQARKLKAEGIKVINSKVDIESLIWYPENSHL